jgi:outer membrane protein OmpA-like peptidoglycan-associated protein
MSWKEAHMASLLELVQDSLTPDVVRKVSNLVTETVPATESALGRAAPAVLAAVMNTASTPGGADRMRSLITEGGWGADLLNNLGSRLGGGSGTSSLLSSGAQLVASLFGGKADSLTDVIASSAGVQRGSATTIMSLVAPIVMSVLGKQMTSRGLGASGLSTLLAGERGSLMAALPPGMSGLLGVKDDPLTRDALTREPIAREPIGREPIREPAVASPLSRWWPALLAGLAALAILFFVARGRETNVASNRADSPSAAPRQLASVTLPDGARLSVGQGGSVHQLSTYLADTSATEVPKRFVFDDLHFESASTRLTPEGQRTVASLLAVLKAYPTVRVALEGHTDSSGDPAANKALSQQRAEAVRQMLVEGGITSNRIEAKGYGEERPVADNNTDAGRARNRRLELVVTQR